jgi:hypothetical protein
MVDVILGVAVVLLPTLFAVGIELVSKEIRDNRYWKWGVLAFGVVISALTGTQIYRANKNGAANTQKAIEETSSKVSASVSESVSKTLSSQYAQTINRLQLQVGLFQSQLSAQGRSVEAIQHSKILSSSEPLKVEVTNQSQGQGTVGSSPTVRISRIYVTPDKRGKTATQFILTTDRVMNGGKALFQCAGKINSGSAEISGAGVMIGGGAMVDDHTFKAWIESPNWAPSSPLVVTLYYDEDDIGTCQITPLE